MGGNIDTMRWLIDYHHSPIQVSGKGKKSSVKTFLQTSKGRSVLDIAVYHQRLGVLHYLVVEKEVPILSVKDLRGALLSLESILRSSPPNSFSSVPVVAARGAEYLSIDSDSISGAILEMSQEKQHIPHLTSSIDSGDKKSPAEEEVRDVWCLSFLLFSLSKKMVSPFI